jgi:hypothetical protein
VAGFGFSGAIKSLSIRGELSYFYSLKENCDSTNLFLMSLATDYTFRNETSVMFEFLYAQKTFIPTQSSMLYLYSGTQNSKTQALARYNFFGQIRYPISPILSATLSGMCYYDEKRVGFYAGPSVEVSLGNNLTLSSYFQFFSFRVENLQTFRDEWVKANFAYLRLKYNF